MSCYIRKLLPRGSSILSGAPFTTSSSRDRLMGPPSQLVSRKIALRPVQGPRHYSRQPNDDDDNGDKQKITLTPPRDYSRESDDRGGGGNPPPPPLGFWEIIKYYGRLFLSSRLGKFLISTVSLPAYVIWNIRPSRINQRRNKPIYDLLVGPVPVTIECGDEMEINREKIITSIKNTFIEPQSSEDRKQFGVIIGPTGTGKTFSTRTACRENPHGVLYTEINTANLVKGFAEQTGVPIEPRGLFDFVAQHLSIGNVHYYKLESLDNNDQFGALRDIIKIVAKQAGEFKKQARELTEKQERELKKKQAGELTKKQAAELKKKLNQMPCLFIDGVDLLAKEFPSQFPKLINDAKIYASDGMLRIVFVSSEGHIMRHFQSTSSYSRADDIVEILDIDEEEAKKYLVKNGLPDKLSEKVVEYAGGRMIFLLNAINKYNRYDKAKKELRSLTTEEEEELFEEIKEYLQSKYVWVAYRKMFLVDWPSVELILKEMSSGDQCIHVHDFVTERKKKKDVDHHNVEIAINSLVEANVFRYDGKGFLRYHNRMIQNYIKNKLDELL